jgi:hypothetical protein
MPRVKKSDRQRGSPFEELYDMEIPTSDAEDVGPGETPSARATGASQVVKAIELLPPSSMMPDRFQPRPLLPLEISNKFFAGEIDCYKAATEWIKLSKKDEGIRRTIEELLGMGDSFDEHGQIKPITGSYVLKNGGNYEFTIETGERRFWAACLIAARDEVTKEPFLRVEVIEKPSRQRQVLENRHASPPNAIAQAREIASLILDEVGKQPDPQLEDPYDYFRQAKTMRKPRGLWPKLERLMQLTRPRMVQILGLLELPTPILEIANWHNVSYRVLGEIMSHPSSEWEKLLEIAIDEGLSSEGVKDIADQMPEKEKSSKRKQTGKILPAQSAIRGIRSFANTISRADRKTKGMILDELADEMVVRGDAHSILALIEDLAKRLRARVERAG